jgi:hypothetical protein
MFSDAIASNEYVDRLSREHHLRSPKALVRLPVLRLVGSRRHVADRVADPTCAIRTAVGVAGRSPPVRTQLWTRARAHRPGDVYSLHRRAVGAFHRAADRLRLDRRHRWNPTSAISDEAAESRAVVGVNLRAHSDGIRHSVLGSVVSAADAGCVLRLSQAYCATTSPFRQRHHTAAGSNTLTQPPLCSSPPSSEENEE